jgi:hypothetical protein
MVMRHFAPEGQCSSAHTRRCLCAQAVELLHQDGALILVEKTVYRELQDELATADSPYASIKEAFEVSVQEFTPTKNVDLIMCLGGDGVILHASSLFQGPCPPVLGFNLGSMGFLAPHAFTVRKCLLPASGLNASLVLPQSWRVCHSVKSTAKSLRRVAVGWSSKPCRALHADDRDVSLLTLILADGRSELRPRRGWMLAQGIKNSMEEAMMLTTPSDGGRARGLTGGCDGVPITLRMRLHCELWRDGEVISGSPSFEVRAQK